MYDDSKKFDDNRGNENRYFVLIAQDIKSLELNVE